MEKLERNERIGKAWRFVKSYTARLPGWAKRRCRKETVMLLRLVQETGDAKHFATLREAVEIWRATPWRNLPPDLPKDDFETIEQWVDRCYGEWLKQN